MIYAIVPVKRLSDAKSRLSMRLSVEQRRSLSLIMLRCVLNALGECSRIERTVVVSSDDDALNCASQNGADVLREAGYGDLNAAINQATARCVQLGADHVLVLPADLPLVTEEDVQSLLLRGSEAPRIVIVSSRDGAGTNALLRTPCEAIPSRFGPGSFARHLQEAIARDVSYHVCHIPRIELDIDTPEDLDYLLSGQGEGAAGGIRQQIAQVSGYHDVGKV